MNQVVILVPVLRRPHRVAPLVASIQAATPQPHRILFIASPGDDAQHEAVKATDADLLVLDQPRYCGDWARKINAAYRATDEPLMLLAGDDVAFHPNWLPPVLRKVADGYSVIGTNDMGSPRVIRGDHSTHPVVTRQYADQFGTIDGAGHVVHEGYDHNFVDDELVGTAKSRQAWAFAPNARIEHLHPSWDKADMDATYELGRARWKHDKALFLRRRSLWT